MNAAPPALLVRQLGFRYPNGRVALAEVSFEIAAGERVGLVGPSGAGKSTLLLHLNGLLPAEPSKRPTAPAAAHIFVDGVAVIPRHDRDVRRRIGLLFQDPDDQLLCPLVADDVAFAPRQLGMADDELARVVSQALEAAGLPGFESRSTLELSLGEKKRVALAGLLAYRPRVLVLDEPFSQLDPRARRKLAVSLAALPAAQLIASHDLDLIVELCPRVLILDEGRIQADGPTRDLLFDPVLIERHGLEMPRAERPLGTS